MTKYILYKYMSTIGGAFPPNLVGILLKDGRIVTMDERESAKIIDGDYTNDPELLNLINIFDDYFQAKAVASEKSMMVLKIYKDLTWDNIIKFLKGL